MPGRSISARRFAINACHSRSEQSARTRPVLIRGFFGSNPWFLPDRSGSVGRRRQPASAPPSEVLPRRRAPPRRAPHSCTMLELRTVLVALLAALASLTSSAVDAQCPPVSGPCRCAPSIYEPVAIICENAGSLSNVMQAIQSAKDTSVSAALAQVEQRELNLMSPAFRSTLS